MAEEKEDKGFRVIDRRGREEPPPPTPPVPPPPSAPSGNLPGAGSVNEGKGRGAAAPIVGAPRFLDLVESLQMGAMANLGMLQVRDGSRSPVNLPGAKDAIDLLGVLQEKTRGNLDKEEEEVLREGLYHLRMAYMALLNAPQGGRGKGGEK
jgi:hypothetical protein